MADALVSVVVEGLCAIAKDEVGLLVGFKKELRKLSSSFTAIQAVLEDAERQQLTKKAVRDWLGKLKDVAYEMEDILEEWRIEALRPNGYNDDIHKRRKVLSCLQCRCLGFKQVKLRHDIGHKIREITERLREISTEKSSFNFNEASASERPKMNERETCSLIDESEIFGRDAVKEEIVNELVSETSKEKRPFSVVSIVGMGGLGKTTLAQLVFNDETIMKHFEKRIWVCVSEDYDVNKILTIVIQSMGGSTDGILDYNNLQQRINELAGKNRFLLVLDDVWDGILWEKLKVALKDAALGSRIVVTTRSRTVAGVMETIRHHDVGILSDSDCWKLFTSRAFRGRNEEEWPPELTEVGEQIVHRCKGVPLAIKAVGSLLYFKRTKVEWQMVLESETWEWKSPGQGFDILPALLLSYYNLPVHLKQCLSFCSLFPKEYELEKDELVKLWMAHGIIKSERREIEEIGETYFDDLLTRLLLQDAGKDKEGNIVRCKMHDLVHDLARFVTTGDYCKMEIGNPDLLSVNSHHLSLLVNPNVSSIPSPLCSAERLRTLLLFRSFFRSSRIKEVPHSLFNHLKFLRTLSLSSNEIEILPSSLGKLTHLRYLDLCRTEIRELPESVTDLCNLQTLKLNHCKSLCLLPSGISKMVKLRHLEIEGTRDLAFLPSGLGMLSSLRTMSKFPVGDENNRGCKIGELKNLNLLRGGLCIENLDKVINPDEAREAELDKKCHLQFLSLECNDKTEEEWGMLGEGEMEKMERVFEGLRPPHSNLKGLFIQNYEGSKFPSWLEDAKFSILVDVYLTNCKKCRLLPSLGKLPSLEYLELHGADEITVVGGDFYGNHNEGGGKGRAFPKLKKLDFWKMPNWEEWKLTKEDGEVMPSLDELSISNCNKLKALPNFLPSTLRRVYITDCSQVTWAPDSPLPLLEDLSVSGDVTGILSNPLPCLPALKKLQISDTSIESLTPDGWGILESLSTLEMAYCHRLASLPNGLGQLKALQTLIIYGCSRLSSLPEGLGQLELLETIYVGSCYELQSLFDGFEQLKSLHRLVISDCPKLRPLANLRCLTALEELWIYKCPLVTEQLEKEKREDWCNISHIPYIWINDVRIQ